NDADQLGPPLFDVDVDPPGAGVDTVLKQFLDDAGGAFDDFSGGNLVDDGQRQLLDARPAGPRFDNRVHESSLAPLSEAASVATGARPDVRPAGAGRHYTRLTHHANPPQTANIP